mgnify:FL=1
MKLFFVILLSLVLTNCSEYFTERDRIKLQKKQEAYERQMEMDKKTCEHYGFKKNTSEFSNCLMRVDLARKENIRTRKMLECEAVRRSNSESGVTGFWGGVLMGARENLACD